ncbi:MAG: signal peptidase I [Tenericutes bacterium HGW-Tenericutes-1]|nr:MAG: signal peptidase I [Tenericutes bacterium HGW-Tenericutes-1]
MKNKKCKALNQSTLNAIKFVFSVILIFTIGYLVFNYVPFIAKYNHYVIATNSMEPIINVGDIVIIDTGIDHEDLEEGQIIAFYADIRGNGEKVVVVHYLDTIITTDGVRTYRTRPEINDDLDPWTLQDFEIVGAHVATIGKVGPILLFAQSTIGRIVIIADVVIIYILMSAFPSKKTKKEDKPIESSPSTEEQV